ncbi:hypothetical protein TNCV_2865601 [Trichonephila clavipes]|nr:hypothetical protein TNCV_2865601 [Trichonephila clavipes]
MNRNVQYKQKNIDIFLQMMISAYNRKGCAAFLSRRESITGESPTSFSEGDTTMPYSGFEPEPTRLQAEDHIHHTSWVACDVLGGMERNTYAKISKTFSEISKFF